MNIVIDRDIPVPGRRNTTGSRSKFPWTKMNVGDSFFVAGYSREGGPRKHTKMGTTMGYKLVPNSSWIVRDAREKNTKGVRVWRTA